jgi:hypothetical protein
MWIEREISNELQNIVNTFTKKGVIIMHTYILYYVIICFVIGLLGMNRKLGFWGYFFFSFLFTPVLGVVILLASDRRPPKCC